MLLPQGQRTSGRVFSSPFPLLTLAPSGFHLCLDADPPARNIAPLAVGPARGRPPFLREQRQGMECRTIVAGVVLAGLSVAPVHGQAVKQLAGHHAPVYAVAFRPDARRMASA